MSTNIASTDSTDVDLTESEQADSEVVEDSLINSDILINESLLTDKQRRVLLATEAFAGRDDVSINAIARNAGVNDCYVTLVLCKFMERDMLPTQCHHAVNKCIPNKTYDDLTEMQRSIVNEVVMNPDMSNDEIADVVGCCNSHVYETKVRYADIIAGKRDDLC
jgi:predicted DNA-binding protein YlxM (UPF0122 family)